MRQIIGDLGHLFVLTGLVSAIISSVSYYLYTRYREDLVKARQWQQNARVAFGVHSFCTLAVVLCLFTIVYNHYFEYHYAWDHSSLNLPTKYMIASFWEGQEGSFLLWAFWNVLLGIAVIITNKFWEGPVMTIFSLVQAFLFSMIAGVVVFGSIKIGSSPFSLLRDVVDAPIFAVNPDFVPEDGTGLNPLLQNYWMVIHPPTLFLGFAATLVPFAYCISGLWMNKFKEWIRPALPWALFAAATLGLGILMGAYWAYETLNFGGYWSWDPVENAIYVPWLLLVAGIHTMITYRKSGAALKASIILLVLMFMLILYSTFLIRSGVLGNTSVHSFTDLGLTGQLLIYMFFFAVLSAIIMIKRWKHLPQENNKASAYSREFWIFMGATTLSLMAFQIIWVTSFPAFNKLAEAFGFILDLAPPSKPEVFYSKWQLPFAIALAFFSGTGQFFWWKKMDPKSFWSAIMYPIIIALLITSIVIIFGQVTAITYILLVLAAVYSLVANITILIPFMRGKFKLAGGSIAHIGIALILLGIVASSGYSRVVSLNRSGTLYSLEASDEFNLENVLLFLNEPRQMDQYEIKYKGRRIKVKGVPGFVSTNQTRPTKDPFKILATETIVINDKVYAQANDTLVLVNPENVYFQVDYTNPKGKIVSLYPRVQVNPRMGTVASPDIINDPLKDLYTHVSYAPYLDPDDEIVWSETEEVEVEMNERFFLNDYVAQVEKVERVSNTDRVDLEANDMAIMATIRVTGEEGDYYAKPLWVIRENKGYEVPDVISDLGVKLALSRIDPTSNGGGKLTLKTNITQKDYVILKALEKPFINVLWLGTILLVIGFSVAVYRRYDEFKKMRNKGLE